VNANSRFIHSLAGILADDLNQEPIVKCLKIVLPKLHLHFDSEAVESASTVILSNGNKLFETLNLMLIAITAPDIKQLTQAYFPIIIQDKSGNLLVFILNKSSLNYLVDPVKNEHIIWSDCELSTKLHIAWQCCPIYPDKVISLTQLIKYIYKYCKKILFSTLISGILCSLLTGIAGVAASYIIANISTYSKATIDSNYLPVIILLFSVALLSYVNGLLLNTLVAQAITYILPGVHHRLLKLPRILSEKNSAGDLTQRLAEYELALFAIVPTLLEIVFSNFSMISIFLYLVYLDKTFACCYMLIVILFMIIKLFIILSNGKYFRGMFQTQSQMVGFLNEIFLQIHKIRAVNANATIFKKWLAYWIELKSQAERIVKLNTGLMLLEIVMPAILLLILYGLIYVTPLQQSVIWLQFMVSATLFATFFDKLSNQIVTLKHHIPSLQRIESTLSESLVVRNKKISLGVIAGDIYFSNVNYQESSSGRTILQDINMTIHSGEFIGIIGESGAGKSTLFKLLLGLETITSGRISLDNINIEHIDNYSLRKQFGVVLQNSQVFPGTILTNLGMNNSLNLDEAWQLAEQIGLADDIQRMPMKMHTYISDNAGESLSGGQKQKILIGRALATNPKVLLLDEATSALDSASQAVIYKYLDGLKITRLVVAHRLSTLMNADKIYQLKDRQLAIKSN
jgi:ABC-type bacteriocin/lantibiotic exporter with double-glycine peptidase domain